MSEASRRTTPVLVAAAVLAALALMVLLIRPGDPDDAEAPAADATELAGTGVLPGGAAAPPPAELPEAGPTERDLEIFQRTMAYARAERLDTLPLGDIIVALGRLFVGEPYTPGTLEVSGPERLVVNLREFDCVTYVEAVLVLARLTRAGQDDFDSFLRELERVRYRGGRLDGYGSRLHYFSEWLSDNERKGLLREITRELGGVRVDEPINFMSSNAHAYPPLADAAELATVRETERRLSAEQRYFIPQRRIGEVAASVRDGDIIAATSSVYGLDVAHTGFAIWIDGRLHLMHAPLVGTDVEISERPLAERIVRITGQDGIMVARPS
jgi:hypothetical protein